MSKEELYQLREEVIKNREIFRNLNNKYNDLLKRVRDSKEKKKEKTDKIVILEWAHILYWVRFLIMSIWVFMGASISTIILLVLINFVWRILDQQYFLPLYLEKKKLKKHKKTKLERYQDELYQEVNEARDLYQSLNKEYGRMLGELTEEERVSYNEYLDYVASLNMSLDELEDSVSTNNTNKMLNKSYGEE